MDDLEKQARAAELQILFNPNHEYKEELIEYREQVLGEKERLSEKERFILELMESEFELEAELCKMLLNKNSCVSHCCIYHGCKYGIEDCPVQTGQVRQQHICEYCSSDDVRCVDEAVALSKGAANREFLRELTKRANKYNDPVVDTFVELLYAESCVDPATNQEKGNGEFWYGDC